MPFFRDRSHRQLLLWLTGIIAVCGLISRASAPLLKDTTQAIMPEAAASVMPTAMDILVSGASEVIIVDTAQPPPTQMPAPSEPAAPSPAVIISSIPVVQETRVAPVAEAPSPAMSAMATAFDPPLYSYNTDALRIEVRRHELKNTVYFTAEIWLTDAAQLLSAFSSDRFDGATEPVSDIADRNGAILAINGDFATFNNGGIIIRNGALFRSNRSTRQLLLIDKHGDLMPIADPPNNAEEASAAYVAEGVWQTLVFGPVLVENGAAVPLPKEFFVSTGATSEPRTAIGQIGPLHYLWIVVDGRQDGYSRGASLPRLQELFIEHGVQTAFNLDGGGSTTLYFDGEIINRPANGGERHVPDILYIGR